MKLKLVKNIICTSYNLTRRLKSLISGDSVKSITLMFLMLIFLINCGERGNKAKMTIPELDQAIIAKPNDAKNYYYRGVAKLKLE